jgi:plasmid stabilization system protein ParE
MQETQVEFHPEARREYLEALQWYIERSERVARRFQEEVGRCVELIAADPSRWPVLEGQVRWVRLRRFPFSLYYETTGPESVQVLAVAHGARKPGYWRSRRAL